MLDQPELVGRIRTLLAEMTPAARAMLLKRLGAAQSSGDGDPAIAVVLAAASGLDGARPPAPPAPVQAAPAPVGPDSPPPVPWPERLRTAVLAAAEPFLVDGLDMPLPALCIARQALDPIWSFLVEDVAARPIAVILAEGPPSTRRDVAVVAARVREVAAAQIKRHLADLARSSEGLDRLTLRLGSEAARESLVNLAEIFAADATLTTLLSRLPAAIGPAEVSDGAVVGAIAVALGPAKLDGRLVGIALVPRLADATCLVDLAIRVAGGDAKAIARGRGRGLVEALLCETGRIVRNARRSVSARGGPARLPARIERFHRLMHHLVARIDVESVSAFAAESAAQRRELSELIERRIDGLPGDVRRALHGEPAEAGTRALDATLVAETLIGLRIYTAARTAAESLALNGLLAGITRTLEPTLELWIGRALDDLRQARPGDLAFRLAAMDAAIAFSAVLFGEPYAQALTRRRDHAIQSRPPMAAAG